MRGAAPRLTALVLGLLVLAAAPAAARPRAARGQEPLSLNLPSVEVEAAARTMSVILQRPFVVDPRVRGKISLYAEDPVRPAEAYLIFQSALRSLGAALVESGGVARVVPEAEAKLQSTSVVREAPGGDDQVVTQIVTLLHENANNLVPVLRPLISQNNTINVSAGSNALIITDYASNLRRLNQIISTLDKPSATEVEVIQLRNTVAAEMSVLVQRLSDVAGASGSGPAPSGAGSGGSAAGMSLLVSPEPHLNALLVRASNPERLAAVRALVARLDVPTGRGGNIHVVYLKFADATRLAQVLRAAWSTDARSSGNAAGGGTAAEASPGGSGSGAAPSGTGGSAVGGGASAQATSPVVASAQPSTGGFIQADPASNSLIITAAEPLFKELRAVIDHLDTRRAQLYVESIIVEVDASKALDLGVQWKSIFNITATTDLSLGSVVKAIQSTAGANVLSTANLVTLDNEEAKIVVGQNVPFVTGSYTGGSSTSSPFQTIERKDVGITLRIRPQIGADGTIRMVIFQESSSVSSTAATGTTNAGPTTNKRSIESSVVVEDGKIIVLGGLIQDSYATERGQVPGLGNLPLVGGFFRMFSRSRARTNMAVFLRPTIMRDGVKTDALSLDRYDYIRAVQRALHSGEAEATLDETAPTVPPATPANAVPKQRVHSDAP